MFQQASLKSTATATISRLTLFIQVFNISQPDQTLYHPQENKITTLLSIQTVYHNTCSHTICIALRVHIFNTFTSPLNKLFHAFAAVHCKLNILHLTVYQNPQRIDCFEKVIMAFMCRN